MKNTKPPVGQAITAEQQERLFQVAAMKPEWQNAHDAATLAFYAGLRACEIRWLRWNSVDLFSGTLDIRRSKTPGGWRKIELNNVCRRVLAVRREQAEAMGWADAEHFVFPWHGRSRKIDPTRPITSWRSAWRTIRKKAGMPTLRFHDGRHSALTTLAEAGVPDWVITAHIGHVDPQMMKTYSHVRREALRQAAVALEPKSTMAEKTDVLQAVN